MTSSKGSILLSAACIVLVCSPLPVLGSSVDGNNLLFDLLSTYDNGRPPHKAWNESVPVEFGISLIKLHEVNEKENSITLMTWLRMDYMDHRLQWNPDDYGGRTKFTVPFSKIWLPDIVLYNSLTGSKISDENVDAVVTQDGKVTAVTPMLVTASCQMDLALFPYDSQSCSLKFASWASSASVIDLQLLRGEGTIQTTGYYENTDWELVNTSVVRNEMTFCCPSDQYVDITATLDISRRNGPYTIYLVIPSVLAAFLILFTFLLPSASGEKIVFCLLLFIVLLLLHDHRQKNVPSNFESVLGEFLTFAIFLDFFATVIAVICYNVADVLMGGKGSKKERADRNRKLKMLRLAEYVLFFVFLLIFIIGTAVILSRHG